MKIPLSTAKVAKFAALCGRVVKRVRADRCAGCGARPAFLSLLCERCEAQLRELRERKR